MRVWLRRAAAARARENHSTDLLDARTQVGAELVVYALDLDQVERAAQPVVLSTGPPLLRTAREGTSGWLRVRARGARARSGGSGGREGHLGVARPAGAARVRWETRQQRPPR